MFLTTFQSRNRDAFRFKISGRMSQVLNLHGFNLVIEMLFVSRRHAPSVRNGSPTMFQSRNRDAFRFKRKTGVVSLTALLFQSRNRDAFRFKSEVESNPSAAIRFQSRNRDAFRFKARQAPPYVPYAPTFQSRNRDAFRFKLRWTRTSGQHCRQVSIS